MADKLFKVLQLNTQKKQGVIHSLINDKEFKLFGALLISELNAWRNRNGAVILSPTAHRNWTRVVPSLVNNERWAYRSMMWLRNDLKIEQILIACSDITTAYIWLPNQGLFSKWSLRPNHRHTPKGGGAESCLSEGKNNLT